ncbi:hypothetical protein [Demequina sp. NBRC 110053]|uniref:hypothetical protein n=1 Tax=Demequina sp. NBRC 110053 TaxID=1570342 RepID=UPI001184F55C|nr:hypothetical protein [Demequina sp. NBRC 110053]
MPTTLADELRRHLREPFPDSVVKGRDYGEVDAVMIDADIFGWASRAGSLTESDRAGLRHAGDELGRSLDAFPENARPYYERLIRIARMAVAV